jgi:hypothetical protein
MTLNTLDSVSPEDKRKFEAFMEAAKQHLQQIDDQNESMRDLAKHLAEEMGIKPQPLLEAARTAHKNNLSQKRDNMSLMELILHITGHG